MYVCFFLDTYTRNRGVIILISILTVPNLTGLDGRGNNTVMPEIEDLGGRGRFLDSIPDCLHGGPHRFGQGHFIPDGSLRAIQYCRRCGEKRIIETKIVDGQMRETAA